ncbi:hypothetical protein CEUSTIGMA_g11149.t1 [Chlamydomonas eustigma]|uniref:Enkurin domain-containing protein n=1 Tax=Chlamydomonas eustigma TaxID=1157962 RepID=A0A250XKW9_9CHLO|nr:hypothetical protein CEUSTIGMA_g11149.t1 [Chlamydomonas eustigma]|eukprot:GAX83724.1 hypothetical protein CEUSTIGMA_g11149.t1 [Chlamydomonas eustigma]
MVYYQDDESVYNLIPREQVIPSRPPRHVSGYPSKVHPHDLEFGQSKLQGHANFGLPNGANSPMTTKFLKSHEKSPVLPEPTLPSQIKTKLKTPVPTKDERPKMGLTSNKNYITSNAVEVILSKPGKVPQEPFLWTTRPGYGDAPMYLRKNKEAIQREKEHFEQYIKMRSQPESGQMVSQMSSEDRAQLILHLKRKWGKVNHHYQGFSLAVDNEMKKRRKEDLERQLAEIERDIKSLERGDVILVMDE